MELMHPQTNNQYYINHCPFLSCNLVIAWRTDETNKLWMVALPGQTTGISICLYILHKSIWKNLIIGVINKNFYQMCYIFRYILDTESGAHKKENISPPDEDELINMVRSCVGAYGMRYNLPTYTFFL